MTGIGLITYVNLRDLHFPFVLPMTMDSFLFPRPVTILPHSFFPHLVAVNDEQPPHVATTTNKKDATNLSVRHSRKILLRFSYSTDMAANELHN